MPIKHLEHKGNEYFADNDTKQVSPSESKPLFVNDDVEKKKTEEELEEEQKKYLNPMNPALWNGQDW